MLKMRTFAVLAASLGALTIAAVGCGTAGPSKAAAPDKPAAAAPAQPAKAAPQTLLDISGAGVKQSQVFTAGGDWDVTWSATDSSGFGGIFSAMVYDADTNLPTGDIIGNQQVQPNGTAQDVTHVHRGGKYYLSVDAANCNWHVTVTG